MFFPAFHATAAAAAGLDDNRCFLLGKAEASEGTFIGAKASDHRDLSVSAATKMRLISFYAKQGLGKRHLDSPSSQIDIRAMWGGTERQGRNAESHYILRKIKPVQAVRT